MARYCPFGDRTARPESSAGMFMLHGNNVAGVFADWLMWTRRSLPWWRQQVSSSLFDLFRYITATGDQSPPSWTCLVRFLPIIAEVSVQLAFFGFAAGETRTDGWLPPLMLANDWPSGDQAANGWVRPAPSDVTPLASPLGRVS